MFFIKHYKSRNTKNEQKNNTNKYKLNKKQILF